MSAGEPVRYPGGGRECDGFDRPGPFCYTTPVAGHGLPAARRRENFCRGAAMFKGAGIGAGGIITEGK
jgi:hypothetical protein